MTDFTERLQAAKTAGEQLGAERLATFLLGMIATDPGCWAMIRGGQLGLDGNFTIPEPVLQLLVDSGKVPVEPGL